MIIELDSVGRVKWMSFHLSYEKEDEDDEKKKISHGKFFIFFFFLMPIVLNG